MPSKFITAAEAAKMAGVTSRYIRTLCNEGRIRGAERLGRAWIVPKSFKWKALPMGPKPKK
jgi:excisionase family DNA binding protein